MNPEWYYARDGERRGPLTTSELLEMIGDGELAVDDVVWKAGMPEWEPARDRPELFARAEVVTGLPADDGTAPAVLQYLTPAGDDPRDVEYAGIWLRFCAAVIDGVVLLPVWWGMGVWVPSVLEHTPPGAEYVVDVLVWVVQTLVVWFYQATQESSAHQATFGKRAVGLKVTDVHGTRLTFGRATGRSFAKVLSNWTFLIGYAMAAFTRRRQALHDLMAGTLVVKKKAVETWS